MSAEKLRRALLAAMEQEEEAEREERHRLQDAEHRADEVRREERENRDSRSLERLAGAFERIADELNKLNAFGPWRSNR